MLTVLSLLRRFPIDFGSVRISHSTEVGDPGPCHSSVEKLQVNFSGSIPRTKKFFDFINFLIEL